MEQPEFSADTIGNEKNTSIKGAFGKTLTDDELKKIVEEEKQSYLEASKSDDMSIIV
jgi:hypothetical protein